MSAFRRLVPHPADGLRAEDVAGPVPEPVGDRPHVALNMIATVDGRATIEGRTAPMGNPADRALFHALRARADAVMVGAGTARQERYGRVIKDPQVRAARVASGRPAEPFAVLVSRSLALPAHLGLLAEPESRVVVITPATAGELPPCAARVDYVREVDLAVALRRLRAEHGVASVLCEGGPDLNASLLPHGLVDELRLAIAPLAAPAEDPLGMVGGRTLPEPRRVELRSLHLADGALFANYAVD